MTYILVICILLSFVAGGFVAYKGVQLGLRWQLQAQEKIPPTMESPITQIVEQKQAVKQSEEQANIMSEWLNGVKE